MAMEVTDRELRLRAHIHNLLFSYARHHLATDYVEWTHTAVADVRIYLVYLFPSKSSHKPYSYYQNASRPFHWCHQRMSYSLKSPLRSCPGDGSFLNSMCMKNTGSYLRKIQRLLSRKMSRRSFVDALCRRNHGRMNTTVGDRLCSYLL